MPSVETKHCFVDQTLTEDPGSALRLGFRNLVLVPVMCRASAFNAPTVQSGKSVDQLPQVRGVPSTTLVMKELEGVSFPFFIFECTSSMHPQGLDSGEGAAPHPALYLATGYPAKTLEGDPPLLAQEDRRKITRSIAGAAG